MSEHLLSHLLAIISKYSNPRDNRFTLKNSINERTGLKVWLAEYDGHKWFGELPSQVILDVVNYLCEKDEKIPIPNPTKPQWKIKIISRNELYKLMGSLDYVVPLNIDETTVPLSVRPSLFEGILKTDPLTLFVVEE